jgi:hypothetical protein
MAGLLSWANLDEFGPRFPMSKHMTGSNGYFHKVASEEKLTLHEGVYISLAGPSCRNPQITLSADYRLMQLECQPSQR